MNSSDKYYTWFITSENSPSYLYLSDAPNGNTGNPTNYCLDLGEMLSSAGFNYLRITECKNAKYKFKYANSYKNSIDVYTTNNKAHTINNEKVCLYYSMTPRVDQCKNYNTNNQLSWSVTKIGTYIN